MILSGDVSDTCDVVIIGGYYTSGKRQPRGLISHFLCGIKDGDIYRSICRVSSGFTRQELNDLEAKLKPHFTKNYFHNVRYGKEKPDMKIDPRKSKVLEIRAAEVIKSDSYDVGYTLR